MAISLRLAASLESAGHEHEQELNAICAVLLRPVASDAAHRERAVVIGALDTLFAKRERLELAAALTIWRLQAKRMAADMLKRRRSLGASLVLWRRLTRLRVEWRTSTARRSAARALMALRAEALRSHLRKDAAHRALLRALRRSLVALASHAAARLRCERAREHMNRRLVARAFRQWLQRQRARRARCKSMLAATDHGDQARMAAAMSAFRRWLLVRGRRRTRRNTAKRYRRERRAAVGIGALLHWVATQRRRRRAREAMIAMRTARGRRALRWLATQLARRREYDTHARRAQMIAILRRLQGDVQRRRRHQRASALWRERAAANTLRRLRRSATSARLVAALDTVAHRSRLSRALLAFGRKAAASIQLRVGAMRRAHLIVKAQRDLAAIRLRRAIRKLVAGTINQTHTVTSIPTGETQQPVAKMAGHIPHSRIGHRRRLQAAVKDAEKRALPKFVHLCL